MVRRGCQKLAAEQGVVLDPVLHDLYVGDLELHPAFVPYLSFMEFKDFDLRL